DTGESYLLACSLMVVYMAVEGYMKKEGGFSRYSVNAIQIKASLDVFDENPASSWEVEYKDRIPELLRAPLGPLGYHEVIAELDYLHYLSKYDRVSGDLIQFLDYYNSIANRYVSNFLSVYTRLNQK